MSDDRRLELDDAGLPVDSVANDVVDVAPDRSSRAGALVDAALTGGLPASRGGRRVLAGGLVLVLVAALAISTRTGDPAPTAADVRGVSARVVPSSDASAPPRILASYAVNPRAGSAAVRIVGVHGADFVAADETRSSGATQSFLVDPDCDRLLEPGADPAYELLLAPGPAGSRPDATGVMGFAGADVLTDAAVRGCWASAATRGLRVESVTARPGHGPWTALDVVIGNGAAVAMSVTAVDVANVDTLAMADSRPIEPGDAATVQVRLPIARCSDGTGGATPSALTWSVGPLGDAPSAFATTSLTPVQTATITAAAHARCGPPPAVSVRVLGAVGARDPRPVDEFGVSVTLRVRVTSRAPGTALLGDDPSRLTSDARPVFSGVTVRAGSSPRDVDIVWHTRCGSSADASELPVSTSIDGLTYVWTVPLVGASLMNLREAACR
jgi:hypothetical protein